MNLRFENQAAKFAALWKILKEIVNVFMGKNKGKEKQMAVAVPAFRGGMWLIVLATASLVVVLQKIGLNYFEILLILWIGNMIFERGVIEISEKSQADPTSMEGTRNLVLKIFEISKVAGTIAEVIAFFVLVVYSGAGQFIIFFQSVFSSRKTKILIFVLVSFTNIAIWTLIFVGVADGLLGLLEKLY